MYLWNFFAKAFCICLITCFQSVLSTEISEASSTFYEYLGLKIKLPVLVCHVRHTGYKEVIWKKDYTTVQTGSADLPSHMLSIETLLGLKAAELELDSPFKLQGYYRCETDVTGSRYVHDYLFQIDNIHTYVGKLVAREDSLGHDDTLPFTEKLAWKAQIYETEMQDNIFRTMPEVNVSVSSIKVLEKGLEVHFYLYVRENLFQPRKRPDQRLIKDKEHLLDILHVLENETSSTDENLWKYSRGLIDLLGINFEDIEIKSTLGCYREQNPPLSNNSKEEVSWPEAAIGDVVLPDNACLSKNGLTVTRMCTGSFHKGATWGMPSGECDRPPSNITQQLKDMDDNYGRTVKVFKLEKMNEITAHPSDLGVSDLHFIAEILNHMTKTSKLSIKEISIVLTIIDNIMDTNKTELVAAKNIIRLTSRYLQIINNILDKASEEIRESKQHLMVDTKYTKEINTQNLVVGLAVKAPNFQKTLRDASVSFLSSSEKLPKLDSIAHFSLPEKLVRDRLAEQDIPCQVNMVFFQNWNLFQTPKAVLQKRNYKVLPTPVMSVSISGGPAWNLTDPVQLYFKDMAEGDIENPVCVHYDTQLDDGAGAWSSEGCEYNGLKQGYYHCSCHHLSAFAVILSESPYLSLKFYSLKLGASIYAACGLSIIALSLVVILFILSKTWRKTVDHSILFCLSLTFLACIIIIFISEARFKSKSSCIALAMIFHYAILATFGWLIVQAVIYRLRFAKKTDVSEIPHFMLKAALSVWGVPIIIIMIMWFAKDFSNPIKDGCWLTMDEVAKISVIPVVILICVTLCINLCATYALTCRYKEDFLVGDSQYSDVVVKFRVAFTIFCFFVLSWLFGFLALHNKSGTLKVLFSIAITLTAYYVSLFFIFQEISFWELCTCCKKEEQQIGKPVIEYTAKSYNTDGETVVKEK